MGTLISVVLLAFEHLYMTFLKRNIQPKNDDGKGGRRYSKTFWTLISMASTNKTKGLWNGNS
jgi:hypothetical protein